MLEDYVFFFRISLSLSAVDQKGGQFENNAPMGISRRLDGNERQCIWNGRRHNILNCDRH